MFADKHVSFFQECPGIDIWGISKDTFPFSFREKRLVASTSQPETAPGRKGGKGHQGIDVKGCMLTLEKPYETKTFSDARMLASVSDLTRNTQHEALSSSSPENGGNEKNLSRLADPKT